MSVEDIHQELEIAHEYIMQGVAGLQAGDELRTDISDVLQTYTSVVEALPSGRVLADKHMRVIDCSDTATENFSRAANTIKWLGSDNPDLAEAVTELEVAIGSLDTHSAAAEGLREIDQLRDALVAKVAEVLGVLSSESLTDDQSSVSVADARSRSAAVNIGGYADTLTGQ